MNQIEKLFDQLSKSAPISQIPSKKSTKVPSHILINDKLMKTLTERQAPIEVAENSYEWNDIDSSASRHRRSKGSSPMFRSIR